MTDDSYTWLDATLNRMGGDAALRLEALRAEASHRQFHRVHTARGTTFVLMTSPPALEHNDDYVRLAGLFHQHGVRVPEVLAMDAGAGYFLLTDLGEYHFSDAYHAGETARAVRAGLRALTVLRTTTGEIAPYTVQRFRDELDVFRTWFVDAWLNEPVPGACEDALELLIDNATCQPTVCVHRDYHSRNLLLQPDDGVGVVDFQDALIGPYTYDLACLLLDCYHRFDIDQVAAYAAEFQSLAGIEVDPGTFLREVNLTGLHRQLKALGIFTRLALRDAKDSHLCHVQPVLQHAAALAAAEPGLAALGGWLAELGRYHARRAVHA